MTHCSPVHALWGGLVVWSAAITQSCNLTIGETKDTETHDRALPLPRLSAAVLVDPADVAVFNQNCEPSESMRVVIGKDAVTVFGREFPLKGTDPLTDGNIQTETDGVPATEFFAFVQARLAQSGHCAAATDSGSRPLYFLVRADPSVTFGIVTEVVWLASQASDRFPLLQSNPGWPRSRRGFGSRNISTVRPSVHLTEDVWVMPEPQAVENLFAIDLFARTNSSMRQVVAALNALQGAGFPCVVGPWPFSESSNLSEWLLSERSETYQLAKVPASSSPSAEWAPEETTDQVYAIQLPVEPAALGPLVIETRVGDSEAYISDQIYAINLYHTGLCPLLALKAHRHE